MSCGIMFPNPSFAPTTKPHHLCGHPRTEAHGREDIEFFRLNDREAHSVSDPLTTSQQTISYNPSE